MDEEIEPLDITGLEDLVTEDLLPKLNALDDLHINPALPSYYCHPNEMMRPTTNELPDFTTLSNTAQDLQNNYMQSAYFYQQSPHTYLSPEAEMANSLLSTTPTSYNDAAMAQYYRANFPYLLSMDFYDRNTKVGKIKNRRRATGIATIDPKTGKKIITAATCMDCYKAKKKCLYTLGYDSCTRCQKRGQPCVKRVDRRCQKVWSESGRVMPPLSVKRRFNQSKKNNTNNKKAKTTNSQQQQQKDNNPSPKFNFDAIDCSKIFNQNANYDIPQIKQEELYLPNNMMLPTKQEELYLPNITSPDSLPTILGEAPALIPLSNEKKQKKRKTKKQTKIESQIFTNNNSIDFNAFQFPQQFTPEEYQQFYEFQNSINYQQMYNQLSPKEQKQHMDAALAAAQTLAIAGSPFNEMFQQQMNTNNLQQQQPQQHENLQQQQQQIDFSSYSLPQTSDPMNPNNGFFTTHNDSELQASLSTIDEKTFNDISNFKFES